ncbi:TPA: phage tail protein, partial [Streptococcus suis]
GDFITYQKGLGAWHDENDHSKGRLEVEYVSPLAAIYGRLEGEPYVDERFTIAENFLEVLKKSVEDSYSISVQLSMEDLQKAGYRYTRPFAGDYITVIDEDINFKERVRIVSFESEYDIKGQVIGHTVTCNDIGSVKKQSVGYSSLKSSVANVSKETESAIQTANKALVSADGKSTVYFGTEFPRDVPKGTLTKGDTLYLKVGDKTKMYYWNGAEWLEPPVVNDVEAFKESINTEIAQVEQSMQAQAEEHDRQVADILSKAKSIETLANQAKSDAANAITQALQSKDEAIANATAQVATVSQALNTAKTDLQNQVNAVDAKAVKVQSDATALRTDLDLQAGKILEQAQAQTALTSRVTTVETLADGTKTTVTELSKTVSKATGDIASVTSRTKTVEDTLSQTRTQYDTLTQTVNTQTGQIDSINRKTADLQSGIDGVTERFENLRAGQKNLILNSDKIPFKQNGANTTIVEEEDCFVLTSTGYTENAWGGVSWDLCINSVKIGEEFSLLLPVYLDSSVANDGGLSLAIKNHKLNLAILNKKITGQSDKWFDFIATFKADRDLVLDKKSFYLYFTKNGKMRFKKPILVSGNVIPSDWSLADEDTAQEIAEYKRTADQNYAGLQSTVSTLDGKVAQNKTEANQTATELSNRLTSLETYKDGESTRAQAYFEASKTETA